MWLAVMTTRVTLAVWIVVRSLIATELTMLRLAITLLMVWTKRLVILFSVDFSVGSEGRDDDEGTGSGESVHYFDFSN